MSKKRIIFLGTGGGGSMSNLQELSTAGTWLDFDKANFYLDPGPGAIWHIRHFNDDILDPYDLDAIFISHRHQDHTNDLNPLVEAMVYIKNIQKFSGYILNNHGKSVFLPPDCLNKEEGMSISAYHQKLPEKLETIKSETTYKIKNIEITTTKRLLEKPHYQGKHDEFGFWFRGKDIDVGYLPETTYQPELLAGWNPQILIMNFLFNNSQKKTVNDEEFNLFNKIIKAVKPKKVYMRHWVCRALKYGMDRIVQEVQKRTGIEVVAAKDGMIVEI